MGIIDKNLAKLAEGRTEITTRMICDAEKEQFQHDHGEQWQRMYQYALDMQNIYGKPEYYQQMAGISGISYGCKLVGGLGSLLGSSVGARCPYCGR